MIPFSPVPVARPKRVVILDSCQTQAIPSLRSTHAQTLAWVRPSINQRGGPERRRDAAAGRQGDRL